MLGAKLLFEADGIQHERFNEFMHGDAEGFADSKLRDRMKEAWASTNGFTLVRFKHDAILDVASVREKILESLSE